MHARCVWDKKLKIWKLRKNTQKVPTVGRVLFVHPSVGDCYYLRMLLHHVTGAQTFEDIRTY